MDEINISSISFSSLADINFKMKINPVNFYYNQCILLQITENEIPGLKAFADVSEYQFYTTINAQNQLKAKFSYGVCLRPHNFAVDREGSDFKVIIFDTSDKRSIFLTVMRLAKVRNKSYV